MSVSSLLFRRSLKSSWPRLVLIALAVAFHLDYRPHRPSHPAP